MVAKEMLRALTYILLTILEQYNILKQITLILVALLYLFLPIFTMLSLENTTFIQSLDQTAILYKVNGLHLLLNRLSPLHLPAPRLSLLFPGIQSALLLAFPTAAVARE